MIEHVKERINTMFADLSFDSQRHLYYVDGVNYPSVSSMVNLHVEKVDFEKMLPYCAAKEGCTVDELRQKWKTTRDDAARDGTKAHDFFESYTGIETPRTPKERAGVKFLLDILVDYEIVFRELRGYSRKYQFAGTMDLLLRHKLTGRYVIVDYKTNHVDKMFKAYQFLKEPFETLEAHAFNKYQIQLSYYDLMLDEIGVPISERILVHLKEDETYKMFPLYDFKEELCQFLDNKKVKQYGNLW
jgi:hypothetical protein